MFAGLAQAGSTLIVSSHVMDEAERCQRILLMRDGGILADGSPEALLARTGSTDFDQAFIALIEDPSA